MIGRNVLKVAGVETRLEMFQGIFDAGPIRTTGIIHDDYDLPMRVDLQPFEDECVIGAIAE